MIYVCGKRFLGDGGSFGCFDFDKWILGVLDVGRSNSLFVDLVFKFFYKF